MELITRALFQQINSQSSILSNTVAFSSIGSSEYLFRNKFITVSHPESPCKGDGWRKN